MNTWVTSVASGLTDYYVLSTIFLAAVVVALKCTTQPTRRIVIAWATMGGLSLLLVLCFLPGWARFALPQFTGYTGSQTAPAEFQTDELSAAATSFTPAVDLNTPAAPLTSPGSVAPSATRPAPSAT